VSSEIDQKLSHRDSLAIAIEIGKHISNWSVSENDKQGEIARELSKGRETSDDERGRGERINNEGKPRQGRGNGWMKKKK